MRKPARLLSVAVAAVGCVLTSQAARASCPAPRSTIRWSYPAQGQLDVPTNAALWVSGPQTSPLLDGRVLPLRADGSYDLGPLDPHHAYTVTWSGAAPGSEGSNALSFTTGAGPAEPAARAVTPTEPLQLTRNPSDLGFAGCALASEEPCFDSGSPLRVRFEVGAPALAWIVQRQLCDGSVTNLIWPAKCGAPVLMTEDGIACARLLQTDGVHVSTSTATYCSLPVLPAGISLPQRSSCTGAWPPVDALRVEAMEGMTAGPSSSASGMLTPTAAGMSAPIAGEPARVQPMAAASGCAVSQPRPRSGRATFGWLFALGAYVLARRSCLSRKQTASRT